MTFFVGMVIHVHLAIQLFIGTFPGKIIFDEFCIDFLFLHVKMGKRD